MKSRLSAGDSRNRESPSSRKRDGRRDRSAILKTTGRRLQLLQPDDAPAVRSPSLSRVTDAGVLLLSAEKSPAFANAAALDLLGCASAHELLQRWPSILSKVESALSHPSAENPRAVIDVEVPVQDTMRRLRWKIYSADSRSREERLVLIHDLEVVAALEGELRLAARFSSLGRVHLGMARELRTRLNAVALQIEAAKQPAKENLGGAVAAIDGIERELECFEHAFETFLAQSQPPAEGEESFDFRELTMAVAELLDPVARHQNVELEVELPAHAVTCIGRRDPLAHALVQVALNGLDAMPCGGRLLLRLEHRSERLQVTVSDSGQGIREEHLPSIWDIHFTTKKGRSGLGLYVARSIVAEHHGTVEVIETGSSGTRFEIELPMSARGRARGKGVSA